MSKQIHRQIGRLGTRSADEASVAMIIKEVEDTELMLAKLLEHTKAWHNSWKNILFNETKLAEAFYDIYQTIPRTENTQMPPAETPVDILDRVSNLHTSNNELKNDMMEEVTKMETLLIAPLMQCQTALKPVKKAIEKRDNKKLDYERFAKTVEHARAKKNKSEREFSVQARAESDLEKATTAYEIADDYLKNFIPPIISKLVGFLPLLVEIAVQIQFTLLQHSYSAFHHYANEHHFQDEDPGPIVSQWEEAFFPLQQEVESEIKCIAHGKAIHVPMNMLGRDTGVASKLPTMSMPSIGRGKKAPPPPPPPGASRHNSEDSERPSMGRPKSSTSIGSRFSRKESPPPPPPGSIRGRASSSNLSVDRDESPPPPLPGPRPTNGNGPSRDDHRPNALRAPSSFNYGSIQSGGSVVPTPLAGLTSSAMKGKPPQNTLSLPGSTSNFRDHSQSPSHVSPSSSLGGRSPVSISSRLPTSPAASVSSSPSLHAAAAAKKKPPPPPPKKKFLQKDDSVYVVAVFDFEGQAEGDLCFKEGERIKVVNKSESMDDWWEGEVNGKKGSFPANYCELVR